MTRIHRGSTGHRPMTDREKKEFYRHLAQLRKRLSEAIKPVHVAVGGHTTVGTPVDRSNAITTVQVITTAIKVLEAMRTEAVYEAGEAGAGYPAIGAAAGISRQAAREQWPGAVKSPNPETGRCPLSAFLRKMVTTLPDVECDVRTPRALYVLDYKVAPAGARVPGCLTHAGLYRKLMGQSAVHVSGHEAQQERRLMASPTLIDPIRELLQAQAHHGNVVAMRELAWRIETDADEEEVSMRAVRAAAEHGDQRAADWLRIAAEHQDPLAARRWIRYLEQAGRFNDMIDALRGPAAAGDRFACIELSNLYAWSKRPKSAADVWLPLALKGDGFALQAFAEALHAAHKLDEAIPVFQRAYEHHRQEWGNASHLFQDFTGACHTFIDLLIEDGRDHQALTWLRRIVNTGSAPMWALDELIWRLERAGQLDEAEGWLRHAVDHQRCKADRLYQFLLRAGRTSQAEALLHDSASRGLAAARREVVRDFQTAGRQADLNSFVNTILAQGQPEEIAEHAQELERSGATDEAITMWLAAAEHGDFHARWEATRLMDRNGRAAEAEMWLRGLIRAGQNQPMAEADPNVDPSRWHAQQRARDAGNLSARQATRVLADLLKRRGRTEEALTLLRRAADQGDSYAAKDLQKMLRNSRPAAR